MKDLHIDWGILTTYNVNIKLLSVWRLIYRCFAMSKIFYVYILTNKWNTVLYTGMTGRETARMEDHATKIFPRSFSARYHLDKLVYAAAFDSPSEAAAAERTIKGWTRRRKVQLINSINPKWGDLLLGGDASLRSAIQSIPPI